MTGDRDARGSLAALEAEYEIVGELGRGGIAIVYLARDRELGREVAIKVIREAFHQDAEATARFEREARTLAQLHHPNIITLYAAKRLPDGSLALVMQFTRGESLRSLLRKSGPFSVARAERVLRDIAGALAYVHRQGIIHRDIKPENIFFDEQSGHALLSDFGIAKAYDGLTNVTLAGVVVGTPAYMSPEQIDGAQLDGPSDLYSLGLVGYELLSGKQPWEGENLYSIIIKQKTEQLPSLEQVRPGVPLHLRLAIERALEKDRSRRWSRAEELLARLDEGNAVVRLRPSGVVEEPAAPEQVPAGALAASEGPITIEFRPGTLPEVPIPPSMRKRRTRTYLAAAAVVLFAGGTATIPMFDIDTGTPRVHAANLTDPGQAFLPSPPAPQPETVAREERPTPRAEESSPRSAARASSPRPAASTDEAARNTRAPAIPDIDLTLSVPLPRTEPATGGPTQPLVTSVTLPPAGGGAMVASPEVAPTLQNEARVQRLMESAYPALLRERQVGGTATAMLLIDESGTVIDSRITVSSGNRLLDAAALGVSRNMKFSPAVHQGRQVQTWVRVPLVFEPPTREE